jgi:two-component system cell cycle response regulator DivK
MKPRPHRTRSSTHVKTSVVLVVDDFVDLREVFTEILTHEGFAVIEAADGREAVERTRASKPDVIVMDLSLPVMDGAQAARVLKSDPSTFTIPILAVTGYSSAAAGLGALFDAILHKPIDPAELVVRVRRVLGRGVRSGRG